VIDHEKILKQINDGIDLFNQYCKDNELDAKAYHVSDLKKAPEGAKE
jgi:hypothetical protein